MSDNATEIYDTFLHTVKRFKRECDNSLKFTERDIDAFRKRYDQTNKHLIPLIHDIKMNVLERMTKFGTTNVSTMIDIVVLMLAIFK